jgi:hypothetical protein
MAAATIVPRVEKMAIVLNELHVVRCISKAPDNTECQARSGDAAVL